METQPSVGWSVCRSQAAVSLRVTTRAGRGAAQHTGLSPRLLVTQAPGGLSVEPARCSARHTGAPRRTYTCSATQVPPLPGQKVTGHREAASGQEDGQAGCVRPPCLLQGQTAPLIGRPGQEAASPLPIGMRLTGFLKETRQISCDKHTMQIDLLTPNNIYNRGFNFVAPYFDPLLAVPEVPSQVFRSFSSFLSVNFQHPFNHTIC